jgi:geranylgeranyl diphosphate synthase type I
MKEKIDEALNQFNESLTEENSFLKKNVDYFKDLNSNGKDIRGVLVTLGYSLLKEDKEYSIPLAVAYEIFQTAILVHDDIIDQDDKRRGKETIHKRNNDSLKDSHISNSIALCMGDYGLYSANKIISEAYAKDKNLAKILNYFNETVLNTIRGELLDVILPFNSKNTKISKKELKDSIMNIYRLKTAHYTIIGPLSVGLILAGATENKIQEISKFAEKVGIAFQIQDDILGIFSDEMGKVVGSDIKEFKQTILYSYVDGTKYKNDLLKYYGKDNLDSETIKKVREIFEESGALKYSVDLMNKYYDEALKDLDSISWIDKDKKEILQGFVDYLRERVK